MYKDCTVNVSGEKAKIILQCMESAPVYIKLNLSPKKSDPKSLS